MSISFGLNACNCDRSASVGAPTIHVTHWGAFQVTDAIVKGKPTLVLFYDGSSPHQPHNYGQLSDLWRTANVRQRIPGSYVIDVDLRAHPAFFDDLHECLEESLPHVRSNMPSPTTQLPFTLMVRQRDVKVIHHADHFEGSENYISIVDTFLRTPIPVKVQPAPPKVVPNERSSYAPEPDETRWMPLDKVEPIINSMNRTAKMEDLIQHVLGGGYDTVAILLTSTTCPACIRCRAEVWDDPNQTAKLPPNMYLIKVGIENTTYLQSLEELAGQVEFYPTLVAMKIKDKRLGIRFKTGYNNPQAYMEKVHNIVDFSRPYVNN